VPLPFLGSNSGHGSIRAIAFFTFGFTLFLQCSETGTFLA
jgi:hypothetical protein